MGPRAKEADLKDTKDVLSAILLADTFTQVCASNKCGVASNDVCDVRRSCVIVYWESPGHAQ